jgi:hypothetical protein
MATILTLVHLRYFLKHEHPTWGQFDPSLFYISSLWDYTVLSHFQCFSMETRIVNMKVFVNDSGPEVYIIIRTSTIPLNITGG